MRSVVTVGCNFSPRAYRDAQGRALAVMPMPVLAAHEFHANDDGQLEHFIDGRLRATVPPEALDDYLDQWPDAAPVVRTLKGADRVTPGPTTSAKKAKKRAR